jgi:hypothetical protein
MKHSDKNVRFSRSLSKSTRLAVKSWISLLIARKIMLPVRDDGWRFRWIVLSILLKRVLPGFYKRAKSSYLKQYGKEPRVYEVNITMARIL